MAKRKLADQIFGAEENSAAKMDQEKLSAFQKIAARMYHTPQLPAKEVGIPALAKAGRQIGEMLTGNYSAFFFVNVLRLDMVYVTLILMLTGIFNTLVRPLTGIIYDKTRTRWGKARPYAMFAPIFYYASLSLLFCGRLFFDNDNTGDPRKILFVFVMLVLRDTFSLVYKVPTDNYPTLMSPNPRDRMAVGLWQTWASKWAGDFLVAGMMMPLLDASRAGFMNISPGMIFAAFGIFAAFMGVGGNLLMAANCPERILLQPEPAATAKSLFYILKNKYMMRNFIAGLVGSWWSKGNLNWDVITQLEIYGGVFRSFIWYLPRQVMQIVSLSLVEPFKKLFGGSYRKTVIFMRIWDMFLCSVPAIMGLNPKVIGTWWKAGIFFAIFDGLVVSNDAPSNVLEGEINREISDYTEYMTGERPDGTIGILTGLAGKVTEPLKALWTIAVLKWSGYDPNIGNNRAWSQTRVRENSTMYSRVFFLYNFANIIPDVINMIPLFFYDIEGKKKADMYAALNERRALIANESTMPAEMAVMIEMMAEKEMAEGTA